MGLWYSFNDQMRDMFGGKVYRLSLSAGCTCPNRDGTLSTGGCIFCSEGGSGDFAERCTDDVRDEIETAKKRVAAKIGPNANFAGYMAYFQSFTNTYGDEERLISIFRRAAEHPEVVALSIGTRPDCISDGMLKALSELNREKPVFIELGLQTIHEDTARYINRCYELSVFEDTFRRLKAAGLRVVVHVIIGLPGEDAERTRETVRYLAQQSPHIDGIKLQLLHVIKGTRLAELLPEEIRKETSHNDMLYSKQLFNPPIKLKDGMLLPQYSLEEYAKLIYELVSMLPKDIAIHRLTGDAPKKLLILPEWTGDKKKVLNTITAEFRRKNNVQREIRMHGL